jgi:AcrR family transcriptional regulator
VSIQSIRSQDRPPGKRELASEARRRAILDAALDVFISDGFASAKLDDIVARAGVAKGTIYLFFKDKEDLFEQVVLQELGPMIANAGAMAEVQDTTLEALLDHVFKVFLRDVLHTKRIEISRLVISEARRFPKIAEIYFREVVLKVTVLMRDAARRTFERGETSTDALACFPQLVFAPIVLSIIWEGIFTPFERLDVEGLLAAHRELLLASARKKGVST